MNPGSEVVAWLALGRVRGGGVVRVGDRWRDGGRGVPDYLSATVEEFAAAGLVALAAPDPAVDEATVRASLTEAGRARYAELQELFERRGEWTEPDGSPGTADPDSGLVELPGCTIEAAETPAGRRSGVAALVPAGGRLDPAGRVTAQRREELAASLEALAVIVRASITTTGTPPWCSCEGGGAHRSSLSAGSGS